MRSAARVVRCRSTIFFADKPNLDAVATWSKNLFYSHIGLIKGITQKDGANTGTVDGLKVDTSKDDPQFKNLKAGDYRYILGSPAAQQGILPVDVSHVGRTKQ